MMGIFYSILEVAIQCSEEQAEKKAIEEVCDDDSDNEPWDSLAWDSYVKAQTDSPVESEVVDTLNTENTENAENTEEHKDEEEGESEESGELVKNVYAAVKAGRLRRAVSKLKEIPDYEDDRIQYFDSENFRHKYDNCFLKVMNAYIKKGDWDSAQNVGEIFYQKNLSAWWDSESYKKLINTAKEKNWKIRNCEIIKMQDLYEVNDAIREHNRGLHS